jgi:recombination protein RecA
MIELGVKAGVVEKSGAWYSFGGQKIGQGKEQARRFLKEHKDVALAIEDAVRQHAGLISDDMTVAPEADDDAAE